MTTGPIEYVPKPVRKVAGQTWLHEEPGTALMLGASRPTVTVVAGTLQRAGLIKYRHGHVTIVDRESLEAASCECYRAGTDLLNGVTDRLTSR